MTSSDGLKLARHALRMQTPFVRVSDDPVLQFSAEYALMERVEYEERKEKEREVLAQAVADAERQVSQELRGMVMQ